MAFDKFDYLIQSFDLLAGDCCLRRVKCNFSCLLVNRTMVDFLFWEPRIWNSHLKARSWINNTILCFQRIKRFGWATWIEFKARLESKHFDSKEWPPSHCWNRHNLLEGRMLALQNVTRSPPQNRLNPLNGLISRKSGSTAALAHYGKLPVKFPVKHSVFGRTRFLSITMNSALDVPSWSASNAVFGEHLSKQG